MILDTDRAIDFFNELNDILNSDKLGLFVQYKNLRNLLYTVSRDITRTETLQFSNLFSRLSFINKKYDVQIPIHQARIACNNVIKGQSQSHSSDFVLHTFYVAQFISVIYQEPIPNYLLVFFTNVHDKKEYQPKKHVRLDKVRATVIEIHENFLLCDLDVEEDIPSVKVAILQKNVNEEFSSVTEFWVGAQLYLLNIEVDETQVYHPKFIILEPDYLIDISAIAECFQDFGVSELLFIKSKYEEVSNSKHIRLGNFANLVVDELLSADDLENVSFKDTFIKDFKANPFDYATCDDLKDKDQFAQYCVDAELQFNNIKRTIADDFKQYGINKESVILEPSFLCDIYGIQGRLDILQQQENAAAKIIELKSGSTVYPDDGKNIKQNHLTQLFLYYQVIAYVNKVPFAEINERIDGFIFYSKVLQKNLRNNKPFLRAIQQILNVRNKIIVNEFQLAKDDMLLTKSLIADINPYKMLKATGINENFRAIIQKQILEFYKPIAQASELEQAYFYSFSSFIAREQTKAKIGDKDLDASNGLANLWLDAFEDKAAKYEILYDLKIIDNTIDTDAKEIVFERTNIENKFVNFREGDICILYPRVDKEVIATQFQVFKCNIKQITKHKVVVVFRYKQKNKKGFDAYPFWALERDAMDASFTTMYKGLYTFISAPKFKKDLLLTVKAPEQGVNYGYQQNHLSEEQNRILNKALSAKDYFLLNGPPGTGKTSFIIKELVKELAKNKNNNILLLAYTNRAVDELCEAITDALASSDKVEPKFIRIGNELSCDKHFRPNLLSKIAKQINKRSDLNQVLQQQQIFVATVATIAGNNALFKTKLFDTIIVDEASQILEPQIIGVLPKAKRFIFIGDHKQLPAIVLQDQELAKTNHPLLEAIGLHNRKNSLFERLYTYCQNNQLEYAYDKLTYQGRMHKDIAAFPNKAFYESYLNQAYDIPNLTLDAKKFLERQVVPLSLNALDNSLNQLLANKRLLFFNSDIKDNHAEGKSNLYEAQLVVKIVKELRLLYAYNGKELNFRKSIGIIAPFRNQIALIKQQLEEANIPNFEDISVDTVERYQGSQRDVIIYSFAIHKQHQLSGIINLNDDGLVDRKLNVALTRAREQMIIIGNKQILATNYIYKQLINHFENYAEQVEVLNN